MKNKKSGIFATLFFTVISILFVAPIFVVLMNSFKRKAFISLSPFSMPDEKSYAGLENYVTSITKYEFVKDYIKEEYTIYEKIINLCDLLYVCLVHYTSKE